MQFELLHLPYRAKAVQQRFNVLGALNALLWFSLRGKPYSLFITDQRLWIADRNLYTYPVVIVVENPVQLQPGRKDTVIPFWIIDFRFWIAECLTS
jgi:hypothetical protein